MARKRKSGINKSQAIREALEAAPGASSQTISETLAAQGLKVTPTYVSNIKFLLKKKGKRRGRKAARGGKRGASANDSVSLSALVQAKKLADQLGGVEKAQAVLAALAELSS